MVNKNVIEEIVNALPFGRAANWTIASCFGVGGLVLLASGIGSCSCKAEELKTSTNSDVYVLDGTNDYSSKNCFDYKK